MVYDDTIPRAHINIRSTAIVHNMAFLLFNPKKLNVYE